MEKTRKIELVKVKAECLESVICHIGKRGQSVDYLLDQLTWLRPDETAVFELVEIKKIGV